MFKFRHFYASGLFLVFSGCFTVSAQSDASAGNEIAQAETRVAGFHSADAEQLNVKNLTESDLVKTAKSARLSHQIIAAEELVERKSPKVSEVYASFLSHQETIERKIGSVTYQTTAAAELYAAIAHQKEKAERKQYYEKTNSKTIQKELQGLFGRDYNTKWTVAECNVLLPKLLDQALLKDDVHERTLNQILQSSAYRCKQYARVKFFAKKYGSPEILAALARFKKPEDVVFLKNCQKKAFLAISYFPDAGFLPYLKSETTTSFNNPDFQKAISGYKTNDGKMMLEAICQSVSKATADKSLRDDQLFQLYSLIEKQNCRLFDPVLKKIDALMAQP